MRLSSIFKGHWAARSCAKQSKGEENPAIHLSLSVLFMLYSPLCLILYGQQQLGCDRHRRKRYKSCVWLYLAITEWIEIKGKSLTQPVTFTFLSSAKRSRETHFYWCFPAMCLSDSQVFIPSQSFSGDTEESSLCAARKMRFLPFFIFTHKAWKHYHHTEELCTLSCGQGEESLIFRFQSLLSIFTSLRPQTLCR